MAGIETKLTYDDLRRMPDDGKRYELIEGEIVMSPAPKTRHQDVVMKLTMLLCDAQRAGHGKAYSAPTDVVFDPECNAVEPDLLFIVAERLQVIGEDFVHGAPDLVVEVLSESTRRRDLRDKLRIYARYGVRFYWIVSPEAEVIRVLAQRDGTFEEQTPLKAGDTLTCPLFPELSADVADIFAR